MRNKKPNATLAWKRLEDVLVPRLQLTLFERAVYSHLLRHSHLEGRRRLRFSTSWLARSAGLSLNARKAVRTLALKGALRIVERTYHGHVVEVLLPDEIRAAQDAARQHSLPSTGFDLEGADFLRTPELRQALHRREGGRYFYCLCDLPPRLQTLDHVVPDCRHGLDSYRNLVSCCLECNTQKNDRPAADHLRRLFRNRRLTSIELNARLRALRALATGELKPVLRQDQRANGPVLRQRSATTTGRALSPTDATCGTPGRAPRGRPRLNC